MYCVIVTDEFSSESQSSHGTLIGFLPHFNEDICRPTTLSSVYRKYDVDVDDDDDDDDIVIRSAD